MDIIAAVSRAPGEAFSIETLAIEEPRPDEILVRILGVGLCHSDLLARDGIIPVPLPAVFGHEGAGEVVKIGAAVRSVNVGDKVVLTFGSCGVCRPCAMHEPAYCNFAGSLNYSGVRPDGSSALSSDGERVSGHFFGQSSFSNYVLTGERNTIRLPDGVPPELMGPLGCGVQTGAGAVMNTLGCTAGSSLLVTGGGSVGLSAVLAAVVRGCSTIIVSEPHEGRRRLALELGATHVIDPLDGDLTAAVRTILPQGVTYAFDTTALAPVLAAVVACLGMRGSLALAGVPARPDLMISIPVLQMVGMGQSIKGLVEGDSEPAELIPHLVDLYRGGQFPFDKLIKTYPLSQINEAIEDHHAGRCVKAVLLPDA